MFNVNDIVLYPAHGVAVIDDIVEKRVFDSSVKFFNLKLLYKNTRILIPVRSIETSGIRYLSDKKDIDFALNMLYKIPAKIEKNTSDVSTPSGWNKRNKEYYAKIQSGNLEQIVKIYIDLQQLALEKELSFGEKKILQLIEELLCEEIQTVKNSSRNEVLQELQLPFKKFISDDESREDINPVSSIS